MNNNAEKAGVLKGSILFRAISAIFKAVINTYNASFVKKTIAKISYVFRQSLTYKALSGYINRRPLYRESFAYKVIMFFASLTDKLFGAVNRIITAIISGSIIVDIVKETFSTSQSFGLLSGFLLMGCGFGAMLSSVIKGATTPSVIFICVGVFVFGALISIVCAHIDIIKNSFIYRFFASVINSLK